MSFTRAATLPTQQQRGTLVIGEGAANERHKGSRSTLTQTEQNTEQI
jgi:hypothetical protein